MALKYDKAYMSKSYAKAPRKQAKDGVWFVTYEHDPKRKSKMFKSGDLVKIDFFEGKENGVVLYAMEHTEIPRYLLNSEESRTYMVWCPHSKKKKHELRDIDLELMCRGGSLV